MRAATPLLAALLILSSLLAPPASAQGSERVATVAGAGPDDLPAWAAPVASPKDLGFDGAGNLYVSAGTNGALIFRISPNGRLHRLAGSSAAGLPDGDGGPARSTRILAENLEVDEAGNVWFAERLNHRVRFIDAATGIVSTIAGTGMQGDDGDGGPATAAALSYPTGLARDASGNLYISTANRIRRVGAADGVISTYAGTGAAGYTGDGGPAALATFRSPQGMTTDLQGNLFLADLGNRVVRRIDAATGVITTVAGNGTQDYEGDGQPATTVGLVNPRDVEVDGAGNIFISDDTPRVRKVDAVTGILSTVAGQKHLTGYSGDGGPATAARLSYPHGLAINAAGDLYICDYFNRRIRFVDAATGVIDTFAGNGTSSFTPDGFPAIRHQRRGGGSRDAAGNAYFTEIGPDGYVIRRMDALTSVITTIAGGGTDESATVASALDARLLYANGPRVGPQGDLWFAESGFYDPPDPTNPLGGYFGKNRIRRLNMATGELTTVAGTGTYGLAPDGVPAGTAALSFPGSPVFDGQGNLLFTEGLSGKDGIYRGGNRVRRIDAATGLLLTLAGNGMQAYIFPGDGLPATAAPLGGPGGVLVDPATSDLYFTEWWFGVVRRVDGSTGLLTTAAGSPDHGDPTGIDGPASAIRLNRLSGFALLPPATLLVGESGGHRIRTVDLDTHQMTTLYGTGSPGFTPDGHPMAGGALAYPGVVGPGPDGSLLISDNGRLRQIGEGGYFNLAPQADAGGEILQGCAEPAGAEITLDGSASTDPDSTPGTNDGIESFEWYRDYGRLTETLLGTGERLSVHFPLGTWEITLRVEDGRGFSDTDTIQVTVEEGIPTPPALTVELTPALLWPPSHRLRPVTAAVNATSDCGDVAVILESITSSEPDDAPGAGDGRTRGDIREAEIGTADLGFLLRAERDARGFGRTYTVTYRATDQTGQSATTSATVFVPRSRLRREMPARDARR